MDFNALKNDPSFLQDLGHGVWIMDNHRWANLVWERHRPKQRCSLVHADYHWDAVDDFAGNTEQARRLLKADVSTIERFVVENRYIRYDSFIAPAVRRCLFAEVHFYCKETDNEIGLDQTLLLVTDTKQIVHKRLQSITAYSFAHPIIFDLCLDLFNKSDVWETGDLWSIQKIATFIKEMQPIVQAASVVTISLSFGYSGTTNDTRNLAKFVVPKLLAARQ